MSTLFEGRFALHDEIVKGQQLKSRNYVKLNKARVFLADDRETGQSVAIKVLDQWTSADPRFKDRFEAEMSLIRAFEHPNVVKILASGVTSKGLPYLVMERLSGRTLDELIQENGQISPAEMDEYLQQIAFALDAAHSRGIVHRDVSPYSIILHVDDQGRKVVKLLDFGLARDFLEKDPSEADLTGKSKTMGKAPYLSPERARGDEEDFRSDIYSLAVTVFEALTGRLPFDGKTDFQLILAHINTPTPPFPEGWSDHRSTQAIEDVVLKAMSKDPNGRPKSAGAFAELFHQALHTPSKEKGVVRWPLLAAGTFVVAMIVLFLMRQFA